MIQQLRRPRAWTAGELEHIADWSTLLDHRVQLTLGTEFRDDTVEVPRLHGRGKAICSSSS